MASPSGTTLHPPCRHLPAGAAGGACTGGEGLRGARLTWPEAPQGAEEGRKQVSWWVRVGAAGGGERRAEEEGSGREVEGPFW